MQKIIQAQHTPGLDGTLDTSSKANALYDSVVERLRVLCGTVTYTEVKRRGIATALHTYKQHYKNKDAEPVRTSLNESPQMLDAGGDDAAVFLGASSAAEWQKAAAKRVARTEEARKKSSTGSQSDAEKHDQKGQYWIDERLKKRAERKQRHALQAEKRREKHEDSSQTNDIFVNHLFIYCCCSCWRISSTSIS